MVITGKAVMATPSLSSAVEKNTTPRPLSSTPDKPVGGPSTYLIDIDNLDFFYGASQALHGINLKIEPHKVTAFIGPSGCGKSTLLRCFNRMNDLIDGTRVARGTIKIHGVDIYQPDVDVIELRKRVGMVFQKSNPFPKSIYENITYGLRLQGRNKKSELDEIVERSLRGAALWDEVKDRLDQSGVGLSGGQQQRLCIARAIAVEPEVILMDEPCSALDPVATAKVEELIQELRTRYSIVIVTHNMQQAARVSDRTAFFTSANSLSTPTRGKSLPTRPIPKPKRMSRAGSVEGLSDQTTTRPRDRANAVPGDKRLRPAARRPPINYSRLPPLLHHDPLQRGTHQAEGEPDLHGQPCGIRRHPGHAGTGGTRRGARAAGAGG